VVSSLLLRPGDEKMKRMSVNGVEEKEEETVTEARNLLSHTSQFD